jgi:hypothetical protein
MVRRKREEVEEVLETLQEKEEAMEQKQAEEESTLTHLALGTYQDPVTREWMVVEIQYNPLTNKVGEIVKINGGPTKEFAVEKFKLTAVREGVVG